MAVGGNGRSGQGFIRGLAPPVPEAPTTSELAATVSSLRTSLREFQQPFFIPIG